MEKGVVQEKSLNFAIRIVKFCEYLQAEKKDFIISKQIIRSGTSIGANIRESRNAQSMADFSNKLSIALKEADETQYWLELLIGSNKITESEFNSLNNDLKEIIEILTSSIKTSKKSNEE